jgi:WD40 repeat protein
MNLDLSSHALHLMERYQLWNTRVSNISHIRNCLIFFQWSNVAIKEDGSWDTTSFDAHTIGCNAVSWAPSAIPGSLVQVTGGAPNVNVVSRFASAGCDNLIKIWSWKWVTVFSHRYANTLIINWFAIREDQNSWKEEETLDGHADWVRDVAWAPNIGLPKSYLASCSQVRCKFRITGTSRHLLTKEFIG